MANTNTPFGLQPVGLYGAVQPTFGLGTAKLSYTANTTLICRGDMLKRLNTGYVDIWTAGTAASQFIGVFWGAKWLSVSLGRVTQNQFWSYSDAAADGTCYYIPAVGSPAPMFKIQSSGTAISLANVGNNADVVATVGAIKGSYGLSAMTLNQATIATTATFPLRIAALWSTYAPAGTPGADDTTSYNIAVVYANVAGETGI